MDKDRKVGFIYYPQVTRTKSTGVQKTHFRRLHLYLRDEKDNVISVNYPFRKSKGLIGGDKRIDDLLEKLRGKEKRLFKMWINKCEYLPREFKGIVEEKLA